MKTKVQHFLHLVSFYEYCIQKETKYMITSHSVLKVLMIFSEREDFTGREIMGTKFGRRSGHD